jgi:hypothetical protein
MPFKEKSAWIMAVLLTALGAAYYYVVAAISIESGQLATPMFRTIIIYTVCLIIFSVIGHTVIGILAPKEANAAADERERSIFHRAGHYSSYFMGAGVVMSLGAYMFLRSGDLLFYTVFASLMVGQIMEFVFQIIFYRTSF